MTLSSVTSPTQSVQDPATPSPADSSAKGSTVTKVPEDKVELSAAAQAKSLKQQGQTVSQIASSLALPTKTIDDYLGITEPSTTQALAALAKMPTSH